MRKSDGKKKQKCKNCEGKGTLKKGDKCGASAATGPGSSGEPRASHAPSSPTSCVRNDHGIKNQVATLLYGVADKALGPSEAPARGRHLKTKAPYPRHHHH